MAYGDVWVNGVKVGGTPCGYYGFEVDISHLLKYGAANEVEVWTSTGDPDISRWYTGGGINRDVRLLVGPVKGFARHGVFVTTPVVSATMAEVVVQVTLEGFKGDTNMVEVAAILKAPDGTSVGSSHGSITKSNLDHPEVKLPPVRLDRPKLWDCESPFLYTAEVTLGYKGEMLDRRIQRFGVRSIEFSKDFGFKLNGRKTTVRGVANHEDYGALGTAVFRSAAERYVRTLKDCGFNAIRTSHNPYSPVLMDVCDEHGVLVVDEYTDRWTLSDGSNMCSRVGFAESWYKTLPEFIRRDRNHPSVILWSLGNELQCWSESSGFPTDDWGVTTYRILNVLAKRYDPTRLTTVAQYPAAENAMHWRDAENHGDCRPSPLLLATEVANQNYMVEKYDHYLRAYPDLILFQSEASTRDLLAPAVRMDTSRTVGYAYWGAVEYWGESDAWPKKGWNYSWFSHALEPYPQAWLLKSYFRPGEPIIKLGVEVGPEVKAVWNDMTVGQKQVLSMWNLPVGTRVSHVYAYSNADEVELFVNGASFGVRQPGRGRDAQRNVAEWADIPYGSGGELVAVARQDGREVARDRIVTAGPAVKLEVVCEGVDEFRANGKDLLFVRVYANDQDGNRVPTARDVVKFSISGSATLQAVDDGDHYTSRRFDDPTVRLHRGFALAVLRATRVPGPVRLQVSSPTLGVSSVDLDVILPCARPAARAGTHCAQTQDGVTLVHNDGTYRWPGVSFVPEPGTVWDLSKVGVVEVTVSNCCERTEMIHATVLGKGFGTDLSPARSALTPPHQVRTISVQLADAAYKTDVPVKLKGMRGGIGSEKTALDFSQTTSIDVYHTLGNNLRKSDFAVLDIRTRYAARQPKIITATNFFPFVDRYGQFKHGDWKGKIHSNEELQAARKHEEAWLDAHRNSPIPDADVYGGWKGGPQFRATGFFRTEKIDGKWWLVDPEGHLFFSLGVTCVYADSPTPLTGRENYFDVLPKSGEPGFWTDSVSKKALFNFSERNQLLKYGQAWKESFADTAHRRFNAWGINTIGNWSHQYVWEKRRTPYVATVDTHRRPVPDATAPQYEVDLRERFRRIADTVRDDPWCVGVFVDNELDWMAVKDVEKVAEAYFATVAKVVREMLPNHLYLGSRFARAQDAVWRAASRHCDVVSFNFYERRPTKDLPDLSVDKPLIVGEFHFGALDRGLLNSACSTTFDQTERAQCFKDYVNACLDHPRMVGCHWFQYQDQALTGRPDGENFQIGFVSVCDVPYPELVEACRTTAAEMYARRKYGTAKEL
jgi:beta-galactosidase